MAVSTDKTSLGEGYHFFSWQKRLLQKSGLHLATPSSFWCLQLPRPRHITLCFLALFACFQATTTLADILNAPRTVHIDDETHPRGLVG